MRDNTVYIVCRHNPHAKNIANCVRKGSARADPIRPVFGELGGLPERRAAHGFNLIPLLFFRALPRPEIYPILFILASWPQLRSPARSFISPAHVPQALAHANCSIPDILPYLHPEWIRLDSSERASGMPMTEMTIVNNKKCHKPWLNNLKKKKIKKKEKHFFEITILNAWPKLASGSL